MTLGSYSIIRFCNNLNDQRINLGVIVWHPTDGFKFRISSSLDRVHAVDPRIHIQPLRAQLDSITAELEAASSQGQAALSALSRWLREGLAVSSPYPARIQSAEDTLERLYSMLVSPVEEIRRASSQSQFESRVKSILLNALPKDRGKCRAIGVRKIDGLKVRVGIETILGSRKALWQPLSLQALTQADKQIAFAKATAMDITVLRASPEYRGYRQYVALQEPKPGASEHLKDALAWLQARADQVFHVRDIDSFAGKVLNVLSN